MLLHSDWLHLRLNDQSQEILLGHAIFANSEYRMT